MKKTEIERRLKNVSRSYMEEYRAWVPRWFQKIYDEAVDGLAEARRLQHPALMAGRLGSFATCYYTRGAVSLLDGNEAGWHDIQCGYWAALYALRFDIKAVTLPAWKDGRKFFAAEQIKLILTLGLAKLFKQENDTQWLLSTIETHFDSNEALGIDIDDGNLMLDAILGIEDDFCYADVLADRKQCCKKRSAWPKRPTEIRPFGVLDVEAILCFPEQASFQFPASFGFTPSRDDNVIECVTDYHCWYDT